MISAELLCKIDLRLKQITGNHSADFGNVDIILIGDLRQLPPVRATPIYKPVRTRLVGPHLWRKLKHLQLNMEPPLMQFFQDIHKILNHKFTCLISVITNL